MLENGNGILDKQYVAECLERRIDTELIKINNLVRKTEGESDLMISLLFRNFFVGVRASEWSCVT